MKAIFLSSVLDDVTTSRTKGTTLTNGFKTATARTKKNPLIGNPSILWHRGAKKKHQID